MPTLGSSFKYEKKDYDNARYREIKIDDVIIDIKNNNADLVYYIANVVNNQEEIILSLFEDSDQLKVKSNFFSDDDYLEGTMTILYSIFKKKK